VNGPAPLPQRQQQFAAWAASTLSFAVLAGGLITIAVAVHMVLVTYTSLPFSDAWTEINAAVRGVNLFSPQWLWQQHNEHRIVLPKLFLAADLLFFRSRQIFPLASILAIQVAHLLLLSWAVREFAGWTRSTWRLATGVLAFCLFCPSQWENFVWPFQTCFVLPPLFASLSFVALLLYSERHGSPGFLLLSIAAALGAQYSLANGNLVWPLLIAAAFWLALDRRALAAYVLTGSVSTFFFFHQYILSYTPGRVATSLVSPMKIFSFVLVYLGAAWSNVPVRAAIGGACGLLSAVLLFWYHRKAPRARALLLLILLTVLFCIGTALLTAFARWHMGPEQALAPRYQTPVLLFWGELALLLLLAFDDRRWSAGLLPLFVLLMLVVFVRGAYQAVYPIRQARWHGFQVNAAGAALMTGVDDPRQFYYAAVDTAHIIQDVAYLREQQLSIFAGDPYRQLHKPLALTAQILPRDSCTGELQSVTPLADQGVAGGVRVAGWTWDLVGHKPASYIVVVSKGEIMGFGAVGDWRPTIRALRRYMSTSFIGFTAYAEPSRSATPITIYAVMEKKPLEACPVATIQP
jgi:hypothetical protein